MRRISSTFVGWRGLIVTMAVAWAAMPGQAYCQRHRPVLLLQQTPPEGGTITPGVGVHHFELNTNVTLTALPKPGYQFVYWLGDVTDPIAQSTIVHLDAPKIVIAIFERAEYELLVVEERSRSAPFGGLIRAAAYYGRRVPAAGPGFRRPRAFIPPERPEPEKQDDFPTPEKGDDFPVPVPEPATAALLALGGLLALTRRGPKR